MKQTQLNRLFAVTCIVVSTFAVLTQPNPSNTANAAAGFAYSTLLGGNNDDWATSVATGPQGDIFVTGYTYSSNFPGAGSASPKSSDVIVTRLDPTGKQIRYSVLVGGSGADEGLTIAVNASNEAYVAAYTGSANFPMKSAAIVTQPTNANNVLFKLDANGALQWSTWLEVDLEDSLENGHVLALDSQGNAYVTGRTVVSVPDPDFPEFMFNDKRIGVDKFSANGAAVYAVGYGGPGHSAERGLAIAIDGAGRAFVAGVSDDGSDDFPIAGNAAQPTCGARVNDPLVRCERDGLIAVFSANGQTVEYASYWGGSDLDLPTDIAVDAQDIVIVGGTDSRDFPVRNAFQATFPGDTSNARFDNAFVSRMNTSGQVIFSTYLGSLDELSKDAATSVVLDSGGSVHVSGITNGKQFPVLNAAQPALGEGFCGLGGTVRYCYDGFIASFSMSGTLLSSTYVGGGLDEVAHELAVNSDGIIAVGYTESSQFPTTADALQTTKALKTDMFLVRLQASHSPAPTATQTPKPTVTVTPSPMPTATATTTVTPTPNATLDHHVFIPFASR